MKLIIDIPEGVAKRLKAGKGNAYDRYTSSGAVIDGMPLEDIKTKIEAEKNKLNAEGDFVYSLSEIHIFDKCLEILKGEDE